MFTSQHDIDTVNVARTFCNLTDEEAVDDQRITELLSLGMRGGITWRELLQSQRILIVAEAGAGKTYECRQLQETLWTSGEPAFFFELATLANTDPRAMLAFEEERRFDAWLASQSDVATFFLDSIDELKLTLGSFEQALRRFNRMLAGQLGRARIVITTRPIPFDQQTIRQLLPVPNVHNEEFNAERFADIATGRSRSERTETVVPVWRNVGLMPLTDSQIRQMAIIQQVTDVDALMANIRQQNAEDFSRRPQDLIELCADWKSAHHIRTHREQVAQNIATKLLPRRNERAALTPDKSLEGARRLALAALLTRKLTIRHSAEADRGGPRESALDPAELLFDWTAEERETLLERALFGFASYGRVRFHHRSVIDYLAAEQIATMLINGMSLKAAKRLLFVETAQNISVVRPSMRSVAAWLSIRLPNFFREVLHREPDVLLNFGDPQSLDIGQRREALRAYAARYGSGGWRGLRIPSIQAHRFASPSLDDDVKFLWCSGIESPEVRELLLTLMELGPLPGCEDIAVELAFASDTEPDERFGAIDALVALDSLSLPEVVRRAEARPDIWTDHLVRRMIPRLFPKHMGVDQLFRLLQRVRESRDSVGGLSWQLPRMFTAPEFPGHLLEPIRECLDRLIVEGVAWSKEWPHFTTTRSDLVPALAEICNKFFEMRTRTSDSLLRSTTLALHFGEGSGIHSEEVQRLRESVSHLSNLERARAFWVEDAFFQSIQHETRPWERLWRILDHGAIAPDVARDTVWVTDQLANSSRSLDDRAFLLEVAIRRLCPNGTTLQDHVVGLKQFVRDQPDLMAKLDEFLQPRLADLDHEEWERDTARRKNEQEKAAAEAHVSWSAFWNEIAQHPDEVFSEDQAFNTVWNLWLAMGRAGADSQSEGWNRRFIEDNFGKETADRMRTALAPIWRKDPPTLAMERSPKQRSTTYIRWQLGLAAIAAESEDPTWATKLTPKEAEAAARYVPVELNGFPAWINTLVSAHPEAVDCTLGAELTFELRKIASSPQWFCPILQNIAQATPEVASHFLPRLRQWLDKFGNRLRNKEDANAARSRLRCVLDVLIKHGDADMTGHLRLLATKRLRHVGGMFECVWLPVLLRLEPASGVAALEDVLRPMPVSKDSPALDWFSSLFGERHWGPLINLSQANFTPDLLMRLVRQAYLHVRPEDDVHHEGAYSPDRRDHAERGRDAILSALLATSGPAGWAAKLELARDPLFVHFQYRAVRIAQEMAAEESDCDIFNEKQVSSLNRYKEVPPTSFDAMFALLRDRLDDLDELLLEDVSPRESWSAIKDERVMRREIARELRNKSNSIYTVDQEAATADEKETDIRLRAMSGQQAVIELKIGDKPRSAADLHEALTDQLVNKYMASDECRAGCLMITIATERTWTHPESGAVLNFEGVIDWLNAEAQKVAQSMGHRMRLSVKGLNLLPRLDTERQALKPHLARNK